jgi:uncharacterized cupredoxin-like copper-binding protein
VSKSRLAALFAVAGVLLALAAAGCGSSSSSSTTSSGAPSTSTSAGASGGGQTLKLSADPGGALKFNTTSLQAKSGTVTLQMTNPSSTGIQHGIAVEGNGVDQDGPIVAAGKTSTVTATLKKGTYTFYCPVPGHKQAGMEGKLTVK